MNLLEIDMTQVIPISSTVDYLALKEQTDQNAADTRVIVAPDAFVRDAQIICLLSGWSTLRRSSANLIGSVPRGETEYLLIDGVRIR